MAVFDYPCKKPQHYVRRKVVLQQVQSKKKNADSKHLTLSITRSIFQKTLHTGKSVYEMPNLDIQYTGSRLSCTWSGKTRTMTWMHMKKRKSQLAMSISFFGLPIYFIVVFLFFFGVFSSTGSSSPTPLSSASPLSDS